MNKRNTLLFIFMLFVSITAFAQQKPAHFTVQQKQVSPTEVDLIFSAKIDAGWHVYSTNLLQMDLRLLLCI